MGHRSGSTIILRRAPNPSAATSTRPVITHLRTTGTTDTEPAPRFGDIARRRARLLRITLTFAVWSLAAPLAVGSFWLLSALGPRDPVRRARRVQRATGRGFRFMHDVLRVLGILDFDARGALPAIPAGPCVVVANHPTRVDISSITAALGGGCTVVKPELYRLRLLRAIMLGAWHIEGSGADPLDTGRVVNAAVERLRHGLPVIIFPEGTRSPPSGLLPFGRTAFEIACRARVPVVSIGVRCDPPWLTKERRLFDPPQPTPRVRLHLLATDEPAGVNFDSRALRKCVEARFGRWMDGAPDCPESVPRHAVADKDPQ